MIYSGLPNRMQADQGSYFGNGFVTNAALSYVEVQRTGIEFHSSFELGQRYHQPLRNKYRKIVTEYPQTKPQLAPASSVKGMNDALGAEGLVSLALVFGEYSKAYTRSEVPLLQRTLEEGAQVAAVVRHKMKRQMAETNAKRAFLYKTPKATDFIFQPGDKVLVWRENIVNHGISEWLGPSIVAQVDESKKKPYVKHKRPGAPRPLKIVQFKRYLTLEVFAHYLIRDIGEKLHRFRSNACKNEEEILLRDLVPCNNRRATTPEMREAKKTETRNLLKLKTFKVFLRENIPEDGTVFPGCFLLTVKPTIDGHENLKLVTLLVIAGTN